MATFLRLVNVYSGRIEVFSLSTIPKYVAISHVWQDHLFDIATCRGASTLKGVVAHFLPNVQYCWVDTLCILQDNDEDKAAQIPLMGQIYSGTQLVVVMMDQQLGITQSDVYDMEEDLADLLRLDDFQVSIREYDAQWRSGRGRHLLVSAYKYISRLTVSDWCTRAWTMQEYALAKDVIWVGSDRSPIRIADKTISAIIHYCHVYGAPECGGPHRLSTCIAGMVNFRLGELDRGRVMELMAFRDAFIEHDLNYGAMAASGTIIPVDYTIPPKAVWLRWCEETVHQGRLRMALLPTYQFDDQSNEGCAFPAFSARAASSCIPLHEVSPIVPASVVHGAITMYGRFVGHCEVVKRLPVLSSDERQIRPPSVYALILFTEGDLHQAYNVVKALGGGNFDEVQTSDIAQMLVEHYEDALQAVTKNFDQGIETRFRDKDHERAWQSYIYWYQESSLWIRQGIPYLVRIEGRGTSTYTVCSSREEMTSEKYLTLDFNAKSGMYRRSLMLVSRPKSASSYHKVAMTGLISPFGYQHMTGDFNHFKPCASPQLEKFEIGGSKCETCSLLKQEPTNHSSASESRDPS